MDVSDYKDSLEAAPRTWLITGGAGFIGSHIVRRLLELRQSVIVFDDLSSGFEKNLPAFNERLKIIKGDIRNADGCRMACEGVDIVLHHAAIGSVQKSISDPVFVDSVNVGGTINILVAAADAGVGRFVFASSSAVYGDSGVEICFEDQILRPKSPYAVGKRACEYYVDVIGDQRGVCTVGLRYFNVYGSHQDPNGAYAAVIPRWIGALISGTPVEIYGDGNTIRDFCNIDDVVNANILAALAHENIVNGKAYNIASGVGTSLNDLHRKLCEAASVSYSLPLYKDFREGDIRVSCASTQKSSNDLGFRPQVDMAKGLAATVEWYRKQK